MQTEYVNLHLVVFGTTKNIFPVFGSILRALVSDQNLKEFGCNVMELFVDYFEEPYGLNYNKKLAIVLHKLSIV